MLTKKLGNILSGICVINYQTLPCHVKGLATQGCIAELMADFGVNTVDDLYDALAQRNDYNHYRLRSEKNAKFYELKYFGQPLKRNNKIASICGLSKSAAKALHHPLWHFIAQPKMPISKVANLCSQLDANRFRPVLHRNHAFLKPPHKFIALLKADSAAIQSDTSLDGYLMRLIAYMGNAAKYKRDAPLDSLMSLFRATLCFLAFRLPTIDIWEFYGLLTDALGVNHINSKDYPKGYSYWPERREWLTNIHPPKFFADIQSSAELRSVLTCYQDAADSVEAHFQCELNSDSKIRLLSNFHPELIIDNASSDPFLIAATEKQLVQTRNSIGPT